MKPYFTLLIALLISIASFAQHGINYKAILKDTNDNVLAGTFMNVQFTIHQNNATGTIVYQEDHNYTTDANGMLILNIGTDPSPSVGLFNTIDWGANLHFLQTSITYSGGTINFDATQFMAVPYAKHAEYADSSSQSATANGLILKNGTSPEFALNYESSGDKLKITENGISGNVLEITGGELYLPQYAGSNNGPLKVDATGKVITEPLPQTTSYNRFEFTNKDVLSNYTLLQKGVQFPDGTVLTGIKAFLMDNDTSGSNGVGNTVFTGIYRTNKTSNSSLVAIYRIDGSDTPTGQFNEFTSTNLATSGSNVIDNSNYIYFLQVWYCNDCLLQEFSIMNN